MCEVGKRGTEGTGERRQGKGSRIYDILRHEPRQREGQPMKESVRETILVPGARVQARCPRSFNVWHVAA